MKAEVFLVVREKQDDYEVVQVCATKELAEIIRESYISQEVEGFVNMLRDARSKLFAKVGFHSTAASAEDRETKIERMAVEAETQVERWPVIYQAEEAEEARAAVFRWRNDPNRTRGG